MTELLIVLVCIAVNAALAAQTVLRLREAPERTLQRSRSQ